MLDAMNGVPAFVRKGRLDIVGANELGRALYSGHFDSPAQPHQETTHADHEEQPRHHSGA